MRSNSSLNRRRELSRRGLAEEGELRVNDLVERLAVTSMTVRRDLAAMEESGVLMRTHGGASYQAPMVRDLSFSEKDALFAPQKAAIARESMKLVQPNQSIFIDTGTTALHVARILPQTSNVRVFTNNLRAAMDLFSREGFEVNVYGGRLTERSPDLVGEVALTRAQEFRLDLAFMGTDAVDPARGEFYATNIPTAKLNQVVIRQSERVVILADSSKLGKHSVALVTKIREGMVIITDDGASSRDIATLRRTGAEVIVAEVRENGRASRA
jgi:DeoR family transcriptional regulator of aga operon